MRLSDVYVILLSSRLWLSITIEQYLENHQMAKMHSNIVRFSSLEVWILVYNSYILSDQRIPSISFPFFLYLYFDLWANFTTSINASPRHHTHTTEFLKICHCDWFAKTFSCAGSVLWERFTVFFSCVVSYTWALGLVSWECLWDILAWTLEALRWRNNIAHTKLKKLFRICHAL